MLEWIQGHIAMLIALWAGSIGAIWVFFYAAAVLRKNSEDDW